MGSSDLWRLKMTLGEDRTIFKAYDHHGNSYNLPFAIKLLDFKIAEYPPQLGMLNPVDHKLKLDKETQLLEIKEGKQGSLGDWKITIDGLKIYQTGYDESKGKWSKINIIELVKDPWLPVVYIGIFMILAGSLYLAWMGRSQIIINEN